MLDVEQMLEAALSQWGVCSLQNLLGNSVSAVCTALTTTLHTPHPINTVHQSPKVHSIGMISIAAGVHSVLDKPSQLVSVQSASGSHCLWSERTTPGHCTLRCPCCCYHSRAVC